MTRIIGKEMGGLALQPVSSEVDAAATVAICDAAPMPLEVRQRLFRRRRMLLSLREAVAVGAVLVFAGALFVIALFSVVGR